MNTGSAKEKKKGILDLLTNTNNLCCKELEKIKRNLHDACRGGDHELIKIYLNKKIDLCI